MTAENRPLRILILCTGNSARSQMAEALLAREGGGRFEVRSAGSKPAPRVNPLAIEALREVGVDWTGRTPRGLTELDQERWDVVLTVCDRARDACPYFPYATVMAHWGMDDPAEATGSDAERLTAFRRARDLITKRVKGFVRQY